jgi:methylmalonic aciduria homocystinuria type C protein
VDVAALAASGFDVAYAFDPRAIDLLPAAEAATGSVGASDAATAFLIGNTRALWPHFRAALATDASLRASSDPLDAYTEARITAAVTSARARIYFGHRTYDGAYLPFQRIAAAVELGTLSPTHLVIHPTFGPWFALRAIVILDGESRATPTTAPAPASPPTPTLDRIHACTCADACRSAFAAALAATGPESWRAWLAVREACPIGRAYRYSDDQIAYHYTKDRSLIGV